MKKTILSLIFFAALSFPVFAQNESAVSFNFNAIDSSAAAGKPAIVETKALDKADLMQLLGQEPKKETAFSKAVDGVKEFYNEYWQIIIFLIFLVVVVVTMRKKYNNLSSRR